MSSFTKTIALDASSFIAHPAFDNEYWQNNHLVRFILDARKDGFSVSVFCDDQESAETNIANAVEIYNTAMNEYVEPKDLYELLFTYESLNYSPYSTNRPPPKVADPELSEDKLNTPLLVITPQPKDEVVLRIDQCGLVYAPSLFDDMDAYADLRNTIHEEAEELEQDVKDGFKSAQFHIRAARDETTFSLGLRDTKKTTLSAIFSDPVIKSFLAPQPKVVESSTGKVNMSEAEFLLRSYFAHRIRQTRSPHHAEEANKKADGVVNVFKKYYGEPARQALVRMEAYIANTKVYPSNPSFP